MVCSRDSVLVDASPVALTRGAARPNAGDIIAGGLAAQIAGRRAQDEVHVVRAGVGIQRQVVARGVGGADDGVAVPRHHEQHAAVVGLGNQDGALARQEIARQRQVHALAGRDHGGSVLVFHATHGVDETPVALITQRARSVKTASPSASVAVTPSTLPFVMVSPVART